MRQDCSRGPWMVLLFVFVPAAFAQRSVVAWTEFTGSGLSLRAITEGGSCPLVTVDGRAAAMTVRQPSNPMFAVTTCQMSLSPRAKSVVVEGKTLKLGSRKPKRIVVIGDTGCRLKGEDVQDCNDPKKWPFRVVSQHAAEKHPDLVIHVGDYYYRETPCPAGRAGCEGSPHGDAWDSWRADFFEPSASLLTVAPWVFARGNHEQCGRGSDGWFRFLDAGETPLTCPAASAPFPIDLNGLRMEVIDSADIEDRQSAADREVEYERQLPTGTPSAKGETWLVTHKPLWAHELTTAAGASGSSEPQPPITPQAARPMDTVDMVVAGHVHFFATIDFTDPRAGAHGAALRPAQLVVGDGGSALDSADTRSGNQTIDGIPAAFTVKDSFGYLLLERKRHGWKGTLYSIDDSVLTTCMHKGRQISCASGVK